MIELTLTPVRSDAKLTVSKKQDTLTVNGTDYDFSELPDGTDLMPEALEGTGIAHAGRVGDTVYITIGYPYPADTAESKLVVKVVPGKQGGAIALPV